MPLSRWSIVLITVTLALFLGGCGLTLAEDVTPPPNYRPPTQAPATTPQPVSANQVFPIVPPDPAQGAQIYEEKCMPCHGVTGMGDGPQSANLPNPAPAIGSPEVARAARPVDWFSIVTNGNLERLMPGFSGSLSDRQRWDVVAYVYSLSAGEQVLAQGKTVYDENCAACHGENGLGDGVEAASLSTKPASWGDQSRLAKLSVEDMVQVITSGDQDHPTFADSLDEEQRYAAAEYVRSLSFAHEGQQSVASSENPAAAQEPGTDAQTSEEGSASAPSAEEQAAAPETISIRGSVTNATPGGTVPEDLKVSLAAFQGMSPAYEVDVTVDEDGSYVFEDVEYSSELVYFVRAEANGIQFNSDILHGRDVTGGSANLPVQIYDTTSETTALRTDRMHVFFDFTNPGLIQVVELFIISNTSDRVVISADQEQPVVKFTLPEGAENLQFESGELGGRFVQTADGFGDRMSIVPGMGQHQVLFAYELPYERRLDLSLHVPLPVDAAVVMVPPAGVKVESSQLMDAGQRDVQGMSFQMYQVVNSLQGGDQINLQLSGQVRADGSVAEESNEMNYLIIGLGVFGLALAGAGTWLYFQQRSQRFATDETGEFDEDAPEATESSESILEAILALDDLHASGGLPEEAYQERRAQLKDRLAEALEREKGV